MTEQIRGQMSIFDFLDQDIWSGKMYPEHSAVTEEKISESSSKRPQKWQKGMPAFLDLRRGSDGHRVDASWEMGGLLLGEYTMHSFGECPKEENVSLLSQILEDRPHPKYSLSARACQGILRRAENRGKTLPPMLDQALRRQAGLSVSKNEPESQGGGKGILIQNEHVGCLSTLNNQSVCAFKPGAASRVGGHVYDDDIAGTVRANAGDNQQAVVYGISSDGSNAMRSDNPHSGIYVAETSRTLDLNGGSPACNQGGMAVVQSAGFDGYNQTVDEELAQPLRAADGGDSTPKVVCLEGNGSRPSHMGNGYVESDTMYTLNSTEHHAVCIENHPADSRVKVSEDGIVQTLSSRMGTGGGNVPMVMEPTVFPETAAARCAQDGRGAVHSQMMPDPEGNFVLEPVTASKASYFTSAHNDDVAETLVATDYKDPQLIAYGLDRASYNQGINAKYDFAVDEEKVGCQVAKGPGAVCCGIDTYNQTATGNVAKSITSGATDSDHLPCVANSYIVRRLTPMECERLQGYPDGWTDIGEWTDSKGKLHKDADSPRYKALGNSIALPFWQWMAERMVKVLRDEGNDQPTMASLFDGIGGFPLVYSRCGCKPIWASEIEEFPIAVTKIRFPEETNGKKN